MFALLEHRYDCPAGLGVGPRPHWDFLIEVPGQTLLATWRLAADPTQPAGAIAAERIGDHRPLYLIYEGPLSGNRGHVRQVDGGEARVIQSSGEDLVALLAGARLRGQARIWRPGGAELMFELVAEPRPTTGRDV